MAKGNQKAKKADLAGLTKGFKDYEEVLDLLIEQSNDMNMPLLAQSFELSEAILKTYKKAWVFRVKEDTKNQA